MKIYLSNFLRNVSTTRRDLQAKKEAIFWWIASPLTITTIEYLKNRLCINRNEQNWNTIVIYFQAFVSHK